MVDIFIDRSSINSSACIIMSGVLERIMWKYGSRGFRYLLIEAGHVVQNMIISSIAEDLSTLTLGGFYDNHLYDFLDIDPIHEPPLYSLFVGYDKAN
jgi:SagB-type dehydrogenase family enzyme